MSLEMNEKKVLFVLQKETRRCDEEELVFSSSLRPSSLRPSLKQPPLVSFTTPSTNHIKGNQPLISCCVAQRRRVETLEKWWEGGTTWTGLLCLFLFFFGVEPGEPGEREERSLWINYQSSAANKWSCLWKTPYCDVNMNTGGIHGIGFVKIKILLTWAKKKK